MALNDDPKFFTGWSCWWWGSEARFHESVLFLESFYFLIAERLAVAFNTEIMRSSLGERSHSLLLVLVGECQRLLLVCHALCYNSWRILLSLNVSFSAVRGAMFRIFRRVHESRAFDLRLWLRNTARNWLDWTMSRLSVSWGVSLAHSVRCTAVLPLLLPLKHIANFLGSLGRPVVLVACIQKYVFKTGRQSWAELTALRAYTTSIRILSFHTKLVYWWLIELLFALDVLQSASFDYNRLIESIFVWWRLLQGIFSRWLGHHLRFDNRVGLSRQHICGFSICWSVNNWSLLLRPLMGWSLIRWDWVFIWVELAFSLVPDACRRLI